MTAKGDFFPMRINDWVPNMQYAADVRFGGFGTINIPAMAAASGSAFATGLLANAAIGTELLTAGPYTIDAKFGRNVVLTASAATGASAVYRIRGRDYLGQPMIEDIGVANADGTTPKVGVKAFKQIDSIKPFGVTAANAVTLSLGTGTVLGLPYKAQKIMAELVSNVVPTAGTFVSGGVNSLVQTSTTADPRGTYAPHASAVPDGVRDYELSFMFDTDNLHGNAHFYA